MMVINTLMVLLEFHLLCIYMYIHIYIYVHIYVYVYAHVFYMCGCLFGIARCQCGGCTYLEIVREKFTTAYPSL